MSDAGTLAARGRVAPVGDTSGPGPAGMGQRDAGAALAPPTWRARIVGQLARLDDVGIPSGRGWYVGKCVLGVVVTLTLVAINVRRIVHGGPGQVGAGAVGLMAIGLLWWRARFPLSVLVAEVALALAGTALHPARDADWSIVVVAIALYAVAVRRPAGTSLPALVGTWAVGGGGAVLLGRPAGGLFSLLFVCATVTAVALYVRSYRALIASLRDRADQAERERRLSTSQAVAAERVRIARELHDVVAHHVSLLVVQAGAVRASLKPGEHPYEVVDSMVRGGRQAMAELRDMLGALRFAVLDGERAEPANADQGLLLRVPQPDARQIGELVDGARHAGLVVELVESGEPSPDPSAATFAAYRIVQEALTNVVRHAPGAATTVRIRHEADGIGLRVRNGFATQYPNAPGGGVGHGLLGMRERAALCGGWVNASSRGEGYQVEAWLPQSGGR